MLLSLLRCQFRHIHHASINIVTSIIGGRQWHDIWQISWNPTMHRIILWLWRCVLWRDGWLLTNRGQLRMINEWIIQRRRHRYHQCWILTALWGDFLAIKALVITIVATINTLWTWHDECEMSMWWCCVHIILFVDGQKNVSANFYVRQLQSCFSFNTRNKIDYKLFFSI